MGMEEETRAFLLKIIQTLSLVMLWMLLSVFFGIYKNYGFFERMPGWKNYLFYFFFLATGIALFLHLRKKWKL